MKRYLLSITLYCSVGYGSLFVITDPNKNTVEVKRLEPTHNAAITQKTSEYSIQALYDELNSVETYARRAWLAKERTKHLAIAKEQARKMGVSFSLTDDQSIQILEDAKYYKGGRYVWGGTTPEGFDCSGYVQYLYKKHHIELPRTAYEQSKMGREVSLDELRKGDLLFFLTDRTRNIPITHVGIYIGGGEFIHAASRKKGIIISPITHGSYARTFVKAMRVIDNTDELYTASL
ncbi:C40 family peptidase [Sulfurovum sp. zt1-1]|uniref:C40 family peptidase n=1 Tax=Sulfurovum zhangzhouensis TaxID=3019067 RepID=A0ABT7QYW3_9BACT|nr:C40 family peptidase [Sulfurovum zhangzhouensis]MDM5271978.1 C40 family peptidase [Sulfurovum zhangzhouensis]